MRNVGPWLFPQRGGGVCGLLIFAILACLAPPATGQDARDGMLVRRVEIRGLQTISEAFVRRLVKTREGQTLALTQVQEDVRALIRSRKFIDANADAIVEDAQAVVIFNVREKPAVAALEIDGNKRFSTDELFKEVGLSAGTPLDQYEVNRGRDNILRKYKEAGYYYATVEIDAEALEAGNRVIYRITEGPQVRVRRISFEGNRAFAETRLRTKVKSKTYLWIFEPGALDEEQAERDALDLQNFYRDEGYLDARAGYRLEFDDVDRTRLNLVFVIEEGGRYRIQDIVVEGNTVFETDRILTTMQLKPGEPPREVVLREDVRRLADLYGEIGYVAARVTTQYDFQEEAGVVVLRVNVVEGPQSRFGRVTVRGNVNTKDEVIRRELRFYPGEEYNTVKARKAEQRLMETGLFSRASVTPMADEEGLREALVEIEEGQQVDFLFGVGVSTDDGVLGTFTINNRNFDLFDWPRTWGELFRGQAFRGAGQRLRVQLEPGTEVSRFRIDFTEPYLFDQPLRLDTSVYLFQRDRGPYDEQRLGFIPALSRRFESGVLDGWAVEGALRFEGIDIDNVNSLASRQIRDVRGSSFLTSVKGSIVRDTTDSRILPSEGYRLSFSWEQVGALGGDYDFGKPSVSARWYRTLRTDVFDRKSILALRADAAWIVGEAPVFERLYAGGFGSLRGFGFRGISPRAGIYDDAVGGDFMLLTGAEYSFPIYAKNVRGVTFLDMGTVEESFQITDWRASVGFGLRIQVDFFGPVPIILDFGFPIATGDDDDEQVFNFSIGASF